MRARASVVHPLGLVVLGLGLAVTAAGAWVSSYLYQRNEQHLLELRVRDAALLVGAILPEVQTPLASAAELAEATGGAVPKVEALLSTEVGAPGSGKPFVSASLWKVQDGSARLLGTVGAPPDLRSGSREADAFFAPAVRQPTLSVSSVLGSATSPRIGYEYQVAGSSYAMFAESAVPPHRYAAIGPGTAFAGMDFAIYLGSGSRAPQLIEADVHQLPIPGPTASASVPFGTGRFLLVMSAPAPLSSAFFADLRWFVAGVGTVLALLAALLVERLVRQRELADANADRLLRVQSVAAALGTAMSSREVRSVVTGLAVPALGASAGALALLDESGTTITVAEAVGYSAEAVDSYRTFGLDSPMPLAEAVRTGEMVFVRDRDGWRQRDPDLEQIGASAASLPLAVQGRTIGAIGLSFDSPQRFDATQVAFFEAVVRHFASALERTRLVEETLELLEERTTVAEGLQSSLLPPELPKLDDVELAACYRPAGASAQVGGDFYDVFALGAGRWLLVVGDVEGRGVEAAAVTGLVRHSLRSLMLTGASPSQALAHVNDLLLAQAADSRGSSRPARFCSVAACVLEASSDEVRLRIALAGHPQPLLVAGDASLQPVGLIGGLLGVQRRPSFREDEVVLAHGEALVLFSDGVTERRRDGQFFGEEGIAAAVAGCAAVGAEEIAAAIDQAVREHAPGELVDDVAILVVARRPAR